MTPYETLVAVQTRGLVLTVAGDKLRIAPADAVDQALFAALTENKSAILELLAGASQDATGRPLKQCGACGCPTWWRQTGATTWTCDHCTPRPTPFDRIGSRILVVAGGEWGKH
jgi:hypothetical protein